MLNDISGYVGVQKSIPLMTVTTVLKNYSCLYWFKNMGKSVVLKLVKHMYVLEEKVVAHRSSTLNLIASVDDITYTHRLGAETATV